MRFKPAAVRTMFTLAICTVLSGCLSSDTIVTVRPDGSGTVEQTVLVNPKTFDGFASLAGQMVGAEGKSPSTLPSTAEMFNPEKMKDAATRLGGGARFVSSTPIKQGDMEGARAVFAFDDVNGLRVDESNDGKSGPSKDPVLFKMERRPGGSVLTIVARDREPSVTSEAGATTSGRAMPPEAVALVKPFLQGLRFTMTVVVDGTLVKTNADHVSGNRITLLDVDFGKTLENPAAFEKLSGLGPGTSFSDVRPLLKDLPGVKVNSTPTITIELR